jgi:hypothetical protein
MKFLILILVGIVILMLIQNNGSSFSGIQDILSDQYKYTYDSSNYADEQWACKNPDNRIIPSGHLPGSTILLTDNEKKELLVRFIDNGPELI